MEPIKTEHAPNTSIMEGPKKKNRTFLIVLLLLVMGGAWFGFVKIRHAQHHQETDDAQVEGNISPVIPRISGYIKEVRVKDNQIVKKGDTLLILDDRDLLLKLHQAEAALITAQSNQGAAEANTLAAKANIESAQAGVSTADAQIEAAKVAVWRTTQDYERYANLIKDHSITQQQYEQALAAKQTAEKQLQILIQQKNQVSQQTHAISSQSNATSSQIGVAASVIKQKEVDERIELTDADVLTILDKMLKQRKDSITQFEAAARHDLADQEKFEVGVLQEYMPQALSETEVADIVDQAVAESGAAGMQDMARVMALVRPQLAGRSDMGQVSALVKARLVAG